MTTLLRYFCGIVGGLLLPSILLSQRAGDSGAAGFHPGFICSVVLVSFATLLLGELLERHLYFAASSAARMPGAAR
jgi:hypothetical protein